MFRQVNSKLSPSVEDESGGRGDFRDSDDDICNLWCEWVNRFAGETKASAVSNNASTNRKAGAISEIRASIGSGSCP